MSILLKNGYVLNIDRQRIERCDVLIDNGVIVDVKKHIRSSFARIIDVFGKIIMPGLVQGHIHFCQTLFRGAAENRELLTWLEEKIVPLELSHTYRSLYASALLTCAELLLSGVTTALDMGTFHNQQVIFQSALQTGIRLFSGPALADNKELWAPANKLPDIDAQLEQVEKLISALGDKEKKKLSVVLAPRFLLGIKEKSWQKILDFSEKYRLLIHTHASENRDEVKKFRRKHGMGNIEALHKYGVLGKNTFVAHCVHLSDKEYDYLSQTDTKVLHCPSANLKLASGIADVKRMIESKIGVMIGSDGAGCNNRLDIWQDIRLAALMAKLLHGASAISSWELLDMVTFRSFNSLGVKAGKIRKGYRADIIILNLNQPQTYSPMAENVADVLVYSAGPENVEYVIVDGEILVQNRELKSASLKEVLSLASKESKKLMR